MPAGVFEYVVLARKQETPTTTTLSLAKRDGTIPRYRSGQCLTVYFFNLSPTLGKQYSISSAPCEQKCTITVKAIGRFSDRLCSQAPGSSILVSDPQGTFYPKYSTRDVVLLAGGMGITPFRSIILQNILQAHAAKIWLFYSIKTDVDMPFGDELYELSKRHYPFHLERFVTQKSEIASADVKYRRMRPDDILSNNYPLTEYLISGSLTFVLGLRNQLVTAGVNRENISTEAYF